jgi:hypothetical protein
VLVELHSGDVGGNFVGDTTTHKVIRVGHYWPTLFKDSHTFSCECRIYQKAIGRVKNEAFPLQPITVDAPF